MKADPAEQRGQLADQRRKVDFDTYDVTVDELIRRVEKGRIDIAPVYQRQFRWDDIRQSRLIESLLLGIPVPPLFMATNLKEGKQVQWEVVDGLQRLLTLVNFAGSDAARLAARLIVDPLRLNGLEKLDLINDKNFATLPEDIKSAFEDRPLKVVVLSDKSDLQVRFDLFERLNTGGVALTDQEIRECVYRGPFIDFVGKCADNENFRRVIRLSNSKWKDGTPEDFVLRFFAFLENYRNFKHSVKVFLNEFAAGAVLAPDIKSRSIVFDTTFDYLAKVFPNGIKTRKGETPVNLFEAISVGAALALREQPALKVRSADSWVQSDDLRRLTTGATNSRSRVAGRIEYCHRKFLGT